MIHIYRERQEPFSFWRNIIFVGIFFTITPLVILISLFSLATFRGLEKNTGSVLAKTSNFIDAPESGVKVYASLPITTPSVSGHTGFSDARAEIVRQYLAQYNSPLEPHSEFIVQTSDKYGLDFRLTTAISQQESNLGKLMPAGSFNTWGWGIHSQGTLGFKSFEEGIEEVSKGLKEKYIDQGYVTPEEIMSKYTPMSNGSWAFGVTKFMNETQ